MSLSSFCVVIKCATTESVLRSITQPETKRLKNPVTLNITHDENKKRRKGEQNNGKSNSKGRRNDVRTL